MSQGAAESWRMLLWTRKWHSPVGLTQADAAGCYRYWAWYGVHKHKRQLELYIVHPVKSLKRSQPFASWHGHPQLAKHVAFIPSQPPSSSVRQSPAASCSRRGGYLQDAAHQQVLRITPVPNLATGMWISHRLDPCTMEKLLIVTAFPSRLLL